MDETRTLSDVLAENLRDTRKRRGLSVLALTERMAGVGRPTARTSITKAEAVDRAKRRAVTTDELAALALALDTTPWHLLAPKTRDGVMVTPAHGPFGGDVVSQWLRGKLKMTRASATEAEVEALEQNLIDDAPPWDRHDYGRPDPRLSAVRSLSSAVAREVNGDTGPHTPAQRAAMLRDHLERVRVRVDLMAQDLDDEDGS